MKAGLAQTVITPPVGVRLSGYADRTQPSIGILDDLYAKAIVLDDGNERLALIVCDLIGLEKDMVDDARRRIKDLTGIKEENIMITATHTHYGPSPEFAGESWVEIVKSQIAGTVFMASNNMKEARIGTAKGECLTGVNRRNPKSPHGPHTLYSWPEGPMDPLVLVLKIEDESKCPIGVLINYSCHPVTLGPNELRISRDHPGYALGILENILDPEMVTIFLQGCCGNIKPRLGWGHRLVTPKELQRRQIAPEDWLRETERLGHILGAEALKAVESITDFSSECCLKAARS